MGNTVLLLEKVVGGILKSMDGHVAETQAVQGNQ
jgi:hypothetical protein